MHGDDKGLVIPPEIAPIQIVIVPIFYSEGEKSTILRKIDDIVEELKNTKYSVMVDDREHYTPGWKFNEWELKGIPLRLELGPRDVEKNVVTAVRRDTGERLELNEREITEGAGRLLTEIQKNLFNKAKDFLEKHVFQTDSYEEFKTLLDSGGFIKAGWCSRKTCEEKIGQETGATIRLIPFAEESVGECIYCGGEADTVAFFARAY